MELKLEPHIFTGLQQDLSASKSSNNFLCDARNIRITARDNNTLLSITNERGPQNLNISITGTYLGHGTLNQYLVVFSTNDTTDYITRIDLSKSSDNVTILYEGPLGFSINNKIETISSYENESIQKIYWTDGKNQPRVINIVAPTGKYTSTSFDFVQDLALQETVSITKMLGASGEFASGTIQYAFTYYNKHGQESNIFYVSPILYTSYLDRGGSPEDKVSNAFKINVGKVDKRFDYIRIYSIQRTSIDATPIVKRVQDINLPGNEGSTSITYIDNGLTGSDVDPTQLLYIGGEEIIAQTLEQKDGTLFLGNLNIKRPSLRDIKVTVNDVQKDIVTAIQEYFNVDRNQPCNQSTTDKYTIQYRQVNVNNNTLLNSMNGSKAPSDSTCPKGFKFKEYYRLGLQFQYKNGKWSEPVWVGDYQMLDSPLRSIGEGIDTLRLAKLQTELSAEIRTALNNAGYKRVRPMIVAPTINDRTRLCQGVASPTMYRKVDRYGKDSTPGTEGTTIGSIYAQSSWIFRPTTPALTGWKPYAYIHSDKFKDEWGGGAALDRGASNTKSDPGFRGLRNQFNNYLDNTYYPSDVDSPFKNNTEVGGLFEGEDIFWIDRNLITVNSPDIEFDEDLQNLDLSNVKLDMLGSIHIDYTYGDIDIVTSSPTVSSVGKGFVHRSIRSTGGYALISGLFYNDFIVDDNGTNFNAYSGAQSSVYWPVYMWHKSGSLNNDVLRPANSGSRSAVLLHKKISNYRYADKTTFFSGNINLPLQGTPQLYNSEEPKIVKINNHPYYGAINTLLTPSKEAPLFFAGDYTTKDNPSYNDDILYALADKDFSSTSGTTQSPGIWKWIRDKYGAGEWRKQSDNIGESTIGLTRTSETISMKYKSTPHIVCQLNSTEELLPPHIYTDIDGNSYYTEGDTNGLLNLVELYKEYDPKIMFGGTSDDALQNNLWIPAGEPDALNQYINFIYGDTYYTRYECLKTYAYSPEDTNQVVDILSFYVETRINIDGRYDRNREQVSNLNMSPRNFNLLNKVYGQTDNFFNYRILDSDFYKINSFPNQITWTKEKQAGADVDLWTNVTLVSTYDLDGSKGEIHSLNIWKDQLYCFQDKGISNILFNSRVAIPTSDGVPIEIGNSYKVDGFRYITDGLGSNSGAIIKDTSSGIYFIDSVSNNLYYIGNEIRDLSTSCNMSAWFKNNTISKLVYDDVHKDLYIVGTEDILCYSELLGQFTSFMDYKGILLMESYNKEVYSVHDTTLYKMFKGEYSTFFGNYKPWYISFISNGSNDGLTSKDKVFSNIEYIMDFRDIDDTLLPNKSFDFVRVENEYQDTGSVELTYNTNTLSNLKKKFRVWRIDIPRNANSRDRIRNPWCKVTLGMGTSLNPKAKAELHDVIMKYYI